MIVPFLDLHAQHRPRRDDFLRAIGEVIDSGAFTGGPVVERFEREFAAWCGNRHAIGVGSGTDALWLALAALGIGPGDEVITAPNSFFATAEAIARTGARAVFADVDEDTLTLDPAAVERAVTPRTRALVPVHLFGHPAAMDALLEIARRHDLRVVDDAAQAHGAACRGRRIGSLADATCFSFYPGKNLGAFGDGGAVVTGDGALAERIRILREHGQETKHRHVEIGWNCRMDGIQAAVLSLKLPEADAANEARRAAAALYRRALEGVTNLVLPTEERHARHVYHIFPVRVPERDRILRDLRRLGIQCGIHYPVPIHLQPAFAHLGGRAGDLPVAERAAKELLSLPMGPDLTEAAIRKVAATLRHALAATRSSLSPAVA